MIRLQNWGDRMYLSRVELDITRRTTMQALAAPQKLHGAVESSFPGERKRRLWRLDRLGGKLYLLVLSEDQPDLTELVRQFGRQEAAPEIQDYTPLLKRISPGSVWRFRLTANPTKSCPGKKDSDIRGTVKAHCSVEFQKQMAENAQEFTEQMNTEMQNMYELGYGATAFTLSMIETA